MQSTFTQRFKRIMDYYELSQSKLAEVIGTTSQTISNLVNGSMPRYDLLYKLLSYFKEVDANWLLLDEGRMLKSGLNDGIVSEPSGDYHQSMRREDYDRLTRVIDHLIKENECLRAEILLLKGIEKEGATGT
ncbi:helix-turn-helix transcriptional regulator [Massilibacteroides sp.]|uniref:helix-turn-helix transcriptional regulator n=1 Tax=Massilibacteroides sp. TaxID=2034766 RepID=UPI002638E176|nr:helix-turn-helix transcriptional regulator [Massilibacteroides sp.]MDD4515416.1 helix-turn-helix transcriptional regulator [Massilibacteroides sp.]